MKTPLLLITTGYETSQLTRFEDIFNKYFKKLLSKTKSSGKKDEAVSLFTASRLALIFTKLEAYQNCAMNCSKIQQNHIELMDILSDVNFLFYA